MLGISLAINDSVGHGGLLSWREMLQPRDSYVTSTAQLKTIRK